MKLRRLAGAASKTDVDLNVEQCKQEAYQWRGWEHNGEHNESLQEGFN